MKALTYLTVKGFLIVIAILASSTAKARPPNTCPCLDAWATQAASLSCVDLSNFTKLSRGHGDFLINLSWQTPSQCGRLLHLGNLDRCENLRADFGPNGCTGEQLLTQFPYESSGEERDCAAAMREIHRVLDELPPCS